MKPSAKWLIVTADDFGISPGVNRGIVEAHRDGILTSTSLMVHRPASVEAAALVRECPALSVGLHLELNGGGRNADGVAAELARQLDRFLELVGAPPTHLDSHHDVHRDPRALPNLRAWAQRVGVPVRGYSDVRHVSKFYGQWGGETHLEQISVDGLLRLVDTELQDGEHVTELTCHPGYVEPGFASSYAVEREAEVRTLCDPQVRLGLTERNVRLIGFRDLREVAA